jgi:hypothetical protein
VGVHSVGFEPWQIPDEQRSVCVQAFPSLQPVPSGAFGLEQAPVPGLHTPARWQALMGEHTTGFPDWQAPA